jgi:hypothetical protein
LRGQPLRGGDGGRASDDLDLGDGNLSGGLRLIAAIGKEPRTAARDGQRRARASESREIAKVRKMGDQEAMKPGFGQTAAQIADAASVVHWVRITGIRG